MVSSRSAVVNYPDDRRALHADHRVQAPDRAGARRRRRITYEYPSAEGDPYYPIPRPENQALFKQYEALADATPDVVRRPAGDLPLLQHGPDRRPGAGDVPADRRKRRAADAAAAMTAAAACMTSQRRRCAPLELWGGVECTVVRIGDEYPRPVRRHRPLRRASSDLDAIAELGIKALRYPDPVGDDRAGSAGRARLALARRAPGAAARAWHRGHRRARPPRQRAALHRACSIPTFPTLLADYAGEVARALSVDRDVDAGQRAADDGAVLVPLRPLVSAPPRHRRDASARTGEPVPGDAARDARRSARSIPARSWSRPRTSARPSRRAQLALPGGA